MADVVRFATPEAREREPGGFVRTATAEDIRLSLELVRSVEGSAMTMIAGAPGVGKSRALAQFCAELGHEAVSYTAAPDEGDPRGVGRALILLLNANWDNQSLGLYETRCRLAGRLGPDRCLVVDEAQYLTAAGLEWLRVTVETAGCNLVLCGDLALAARVEGIPQLRSRMRRPVVIGAVERADIEAVAANVGVEGREAINLLAAAAKQPGGLRNVESVLRIALMVAGSGVPKLAHIRAAMIEEKLAPKGGK